MVTKEAGVYKEEVMWIAFGFGNFKIYLKQGII